MNGTNVTIYRARSDSSNSVYEVKFYEDGSVWCECPARRFSNTGSCKHIDRLRRQGAGYKAATEVKVFSLTHGSSSTHLVSKDADDVVEALKRATNLLAVGGELVVKRVV